jgi:hypothetical protein
MPKIGTQKGPKSSKGYLSPDDSIKPSNITIYCSPFSSFVKTTTTIIFFLSLVFNYEEGGTAITNYELLFELTKFLSYEGFS